MSFSRDVLDRVSAALKREYALASKGADDQLQQQLHATHEAVCAAYDTARHLVQCALPGPYEGQDKVVAALSGQLGEVWTTAVWDQHSAAMVALRQTAAEFPVTLGDNITEPSAHDAALQWSKHVRQRALYTPQETMESIRRGFGGAVAVSQNQSGDQISRQDIDALGIQLLARHHGYEDGKITNHSPMLAKDLRDRLEKHFGCEKDKLKKQTSDFFKRQFKHGKNTELKPHDAYKATCENEAMLCRFFQTKLDDGLSFGTTKEAGALDSVTERGY